MSWRYQGWVPSINTSPAARFSWPAVAVLLAGALVICGCLGARPSEPAVVPSTVGLIRQIDDDRGALVITLEDGRVLRFGREAAQLGEQPPREGVLLVAGEDAQGQWLMPVLGHEGIFVFHGSGYDEGRRIVVRPDPPAIASGPPRLVSLAKAAGFSGGVHEERGIYDSPIGTFALDASGAVTGYQP